LLKNVTIFAVPKIKSAKLRGVEQANENILSLLKEATGKTDISSVDFKNVENTTKDRIDFKKVRGSVRLMSRKIKTPIEVAAMREAFLALQIP
jgi:Xaa-Pro aminopeptidase